MAEKILKGIKFPGLEGTYMIPVGGGSTDLSNYYNKEEVDSKIGDISTALDSIIAIQEELIGTISFKIFGGEYTALTGMTWLEWVASPYNTLGIIIDGSHVITEDGDPIILDDENGEASISQRAEFEIIAGGDYTI